MEYMQCMVKTAYDPLSHNQSQSVAYISQSARSDMIICW